MGSPERIGGRFELGAELGSGGMGIVHSAVDVRTGQRVALKRLRADVPGAVLGRFIREGQLLARYSHPRIVAHVASDLSSNSPWIAMELLEGEDLSARLTRESLSEPEVAMVTSDVLAALAELHGSGVVHRDLKPSNIFLERASGRAKLIDLGIAREWDAEATVLTASGTLIGTPSYMSPEQARGELVDYRADLWSVGAIVFELIAGQPPFTGPHPFAVLGKIVLGDIPCLADVATAVPQWADTIVSGALKRAPEDRFPSADAMARAVHEARKDSRTSFIPSTSMRVGIRDRRLLIALFVAPSASKMAQEVERALREFTGDVARVRDGLLVARFGAERSNPADAVICVHAALRARDIDPASRTAIAMARASDGDEAFERGALLLDSAEAGMVVANESMAAVFANRVAYRSLDDRLVIDGAGASSPAIGAGAFIGREAEIGRLEALCHAVAADASRSAIAIVGDPGIGKSRLVSELIARIQGSTPSAVVLTCRADPLEIESAYSTVARGTRAIASSELQDPHRAVAWFRQHGISDPDLPFLCHLLGLDAGAAGFDDWQATASTPELLRGRVAQAWLNWIAGLASSQLVLLVLEDMQWADKASVDLLARSIDDRPGALMLVATGRLEARRLHPQSFEAPLRDVMALGPLKPRGAERLVRDVGPSMPNEHVRAICERAGGNPLFIKELVRAEWVDDLRALPPSLEYLSQHRLDGLTVGARQVAAAGGCVGMRFMEEELEHVLRRQIGADVQELVSAEVFARELACGAERRDLGFTHSLLRDVAIASVAEEHLRRWHARIYDWLHRPEKRTKPELLGHHAASAGHHAAAAAHYGEAADAALALHQEQLAAMLFLRALRNGSRGEVAPSMLVLWLERLASALALVRNIPGLLEVVEAGVATVGKFGTAAEHGKSLISAASALLSAREFKRSSEMFSEAQRALTSDPAEWEAARLIRIRLLNAGHRFIEAKEILDAVPGPERTFDLLIASAVNAMALGSMESAEAYVARARSRADTPLRHQRVDFLDQIMPYFRGDLAEAARISRDALAHARREGLVHMQMLHAHNLGDVLQHLGEYKEAIGCLEEALSLARATDAEATARYTRALLELSREQDPERTVELVNTQIRWLVAASDTWNATNLLVSLARWCLERGAATLAHESVRRAIELASIGDIPYPIAREIRSLLERCDGTDDPRTAT